MDNEKKNFSSEEELIDYYCSKPHPKTFDPAIMLVLILTSVLGGIIGMELIVRFGLSTNSSIIGALIAVLIGMIPLKGTRKFRNIHVQNIIETAISCATFGAGNVLLVCVSVIWVFDKPELCIPMLIGGSIAFLVDITMMNWLFDTPLFGANETWPIGIATAETILAAAELGKKAIVMVTGIATGIIGTWIGLPMDIVGVCGLGNIVALTAFCIALILNGYWETWFGFTLGTYYVPQGFMVGAGIVGLIQAIIMIVRQRRAKAEGHMRAAVKMEDTMVDAASGTTVNEHGMEGEVKEKLEKEETASETKEYQYSRSVQDLQKSMIRGIILYIIGALIMAVMGGLYNAMSPGKLVLWVIYAMVAAIVSEILVGISAMHSGYFPAMATVLIFLVLGMFMGFPPIALAFLSGYTACTGPAFADMGYDLKTGWILRGKGKNPEYELEGRKQQYIAEMSGSAVAIVLVIIFYRVYFTAGRIPPVASVYKATIEAGVDFVVLRNILIWACCGAALQLVSGLKRQIGILFSAGLLIMMPKAGVAGLIVLAIRVFIQKKYGEEGTKVLNVFSAGLIAGSALFSFFKNSFRIAKN